MARQVLSDSMLAAVQRVQLRGAVVGIGALVALNSVSSRQRMSHENGIACRGMVRVVDEPDIPEHDFFVPGRQFRCRVRHGAASWLDDAKLVVRSASVKFADSPGESPLDVLMNTGDVPLFWNARNFWTFTKGTVAGRGKNWLADLWLNPQVGRGGADGVRRDPESYAELVYNSQTCFGFVGSDGVYRYARYRLQPLDLDGEESGRPGAEDRDHPWLQNPLPDETRSRNYLKDELEHRLNAGGAPVRYMLRIQLRERPATGEPDWVTSEFPWDEVVTPFRDLAVVTLTEALSHEESQRTWFDLGNHPDTLPIPLGCSIDDPHSLNDLRIAGKWGRQARFLAYRLRGVPGPIPDSRLAPDWKAAPPMAMPPGPDH